MATTKHSTRKTSGRKSGSPSSKAGASRAPVSRRAGEAALATRRSGQGRSSGPKAPASKQRTATKRPARPGATRKSTGSAPAGRKSPGASRSRAGAMDALTLLKQDHDNVDQMFKKYDRMKEGDARKLALRELILEELRVHAQVEEEFFYPALKTLFEEGGKDKAVELIEEADVEHASLKWLIEQLEVGDQRDEGMTDARVKVLGEYVRHHVKEEEGEIFKAARKVDLDLVDLGRRMDARKRQLKGEAPVDGGGESGNDEGMQIDEPARMASGWTTP